MAAYRFDTVEVGDDFRFGSVIYQSLTTRTIGNISIDSALPGASYVFPLQGTWAAADKTATLNGVALSITEQDAYSITFTVPAPYADSSAFYPLNLNIAYDIAVTDGDGTVTKPSGFKINVPAQPTYWYVSSITGGPSWDQSSVLYQSTGVSNGDSFILEVTAGGPMSSVGTDGSWVADGPIRFRVKAFNSEGWAEEWATFSIGDDAAAIPVSASMSSDGTTLTVTFDEVVFGEPSLTVNAFFGNTTAAYASGSGTVSVVFTTAREIAPEDALSINYTTGLVSVIGDAVAPFANFPVTNGSEADSAPPVLMSARVELGGETVRMAFSESVAIGAGGNAGFALTASGGAATLSYDSGDGTSLLYYTVNRALAATETVSLAYTQPGNGVEDAAGNDLASFSGVRVSFDGSGDDSLIRTTKRRAVRPIFGKVSR
jgi:hypothetical protein